MDFEYAAPLLRHSEGMIQHYIPVPDPIAKTIMAGGTRRLIITLNGKTFRRALHNRKTGEYYLMIGKQVVKEIGAEIGQTIMVRIQVDPDPDHVELPEELVVALAQDEKAGKRFADMTPGRQRSLAIYVSGAKRVETRIKRALELAYKLRTNTLYGDGDRERQ